MSTNLAFRTVSCLIWALAIWHSWVSRGLFIDGAQLLLNVVHQEWFISFRSPRLYAAVAPQLPLVLGIAAGVEDLHRLSQLWSFSLFALPTGIYQIALYRARNDATLLAAVVAAIAIVFMTTSFFIIGEYHVAFAITILSAVYLATGSRLRSGDGVVLAASAMLFSRSYEVTLYLGPLLAAMTLWRLSHATFKSRLATILYLVAAAFFLGGMLMAIESLIYPFDPEGLKETYAHVFDFWQNMLFDMALVAASIVVLWALIRPFDMETIRPYLWASLVLALLALSPLLALTDTIFRPLARTHYVARLAAGPVAAAIVVFIWAYSAELHKRFIALILLRRPQAAGRFLRFSCLLFAATLPADIFLTKSWIDYHDALRATVSSQRGLIAFEDTSLSRWPHVLLIEPWNLPSQSLVVRPLHGGGIVVPPRDYRGWTPFPPQNAPDLGRFHWRD